MRIPRISTTPNPGHTRASTKPGAIQGRIEIGPLTRIAEASRSRLSNPGGDLLAERRVYLDGEPFGVVRQWQREAYRMDAYGQRQAGRGLPTEWRYTDPDGVDYPAYAHRVLAHCLFESLTVATGGSL